jgi:hypothetical protein
MSNLLSSQLVFAAFLPVHDRMVGPSSALVLVMGVGVGLMANTAFLTPSANPGAPIIFSQGLPVKEGLKYVDHDVDRLRADDDRGLPARFVDPWITLEKTDEYKLTGKEGYNGESI